MASDRRTAYTKNAIKEALFELIEDSAIDEITVKEICAKADINRATFYRHYTDIYDLYEAIATELSAPSLDHNVDNESFIEHLPEQLAMMREHTAFYRSMRANGMSFQVSQANIDENRQRYVKARMQAGESVFFAKATFDFVQCGVTGMMEAWLRNGCIEPIEDVVAAVTELTSRAYGKR